MATKKRAVGEKFRPTVEVVREKEGLPTRIVMCGQEYHAVYHDHHKSSKFDNARTRRRKRREAEKANK